MAFARDPRHLNPAYQGDPARYHRTRAFPPGIGTQVVQRLLQVVGRPRRAVDLGAGTGRIARPLAQQGVPVLAVDLSPGMAAFLARHAQGLPLRVLVADARRLPLPATGFEAVLTVHMLHLLPDPQRVLHEARRILAPDGWLAIGLQEHAADAPVAWAQRLWHAALQREGLPQPMAGWRTYDRIWDLAAAAGFQRQGRLVAARWQVAVNPRAVWEGVRERRYSPYWGLSAPRHASLSQRLWRVYARRFGWGNRTRAEGRRFVWYLFRAAGA